MKKRQLFIMICFALLLVITACGQKSKEDIVKGLTKQVEEMKSYKVNAKMTLTMGNDVQVYDIEVWHQKPNFYRVHLKNDEKEQSQMIIRNENDVFVLTPALNKSFRFQSDWPNNSSQAYLLQSLVQDIVEDENAKFTETKEHYIFETKTRYQNNKMLPIQEIKFQKKGLIPVSVKVMDPDRKEFVKVKFATVKFNTQFEKDDFDLKKNMTSARLQLPTATEVAGDDFTVKYPTAEIQGVSLVEEKEVASADGRRIIQTYAGEGKSFTFVQERAVIETAVADVTTSTLVKGDPVDLNVTVGAITSNSIVWTHNGIDYMIASNDLTEEQFIALANSVQSGRVVK